MDDDPYDILRPFLVNMKRSLCMDNLKIYLLAEDVIGDDDIVRLTITAQLSKNDVMMNLRDIVGRRNVLDKFLNALKRSSIEDNNPGHKELFEMINQERERRLSMISIPHEGDMPNQEKINVQECETDGNRTEPNLDDRESSGDELDGVVATENPVSEVDRAAAVVTQKLHHDTGQCHHTSKATQGYRACICTFLLIAGIITSGIVLLAIGATILTYGIYGILGKDKCAQNITIVLNKKKSFSDAFIGFDITLGADIIFLGIVLILFAFIIRLYKRREDKCANCYRALVFLEIFFLILFLCAFFVLFSYVFYLIYYVYFYYNTWKREVINCSSPVFYIAFAYLTIHVIVAIWTQYDSLDFFLCCFMRT